MGKIYLLFAGLFLLIMVFAGANKISAEWVVDTDPPYFTNPNGTLCFTPTTWVEPSGTVYDELSGVNSVDLYLYSNTDNFATSKAGPFYASLSSAGSTYTDWSYTSTPLIKTSLDSLGTGHFYIIKAAATDVSGNISANTPVYRGLNSTTGFDYELSCSNPWIKTTGGDVHTNGTINISGGP